MNAFEALNHLYSGYNARHVALALIDHYQKPEGLGDELKRSDRAIEQVREWAGRIWEGAPLLVGIDVAPGAEGAKIIRLLEILAKELESFADHLETVLKPGPDAMARADFIAAAAAVARAAHREYYLLQGFINFAKRVGSPDLLAPYEAMQPQVNYNHQVALALIERLAKFDEWAIEEKRRLWVKALGLPGGFRVSAVDLIELIRKNLAEPTEQRFGMDPRIFAGFVQQGYAAYAAAAWLAAGLGPTDAVAWRAQGLDHPGLANDWISRGFSLAAALAWMAQGYAAEDAAMRANNFI